MDRLGDWNKVNVQERRHIKQYTIAQYEPEDGSPDQLETMSSEDCFVQIDRYRNRAGKNARGPVEALRDALKIMHYGQVIYLKLKKELGITDDIYPDPNPDEGCWTITSRRRLTYDPCKTKL